MAEKPEERFRDQEVIFGEANLSREEELHDDDEYMFGHLQVHNT